MRRVAAIVLGVAAFSLATEAAANGKFPAADQLVINPTDPTHIVARTTFGILSSRNGGVDWDWTCESGAGYVDIEPGIQFAGDGSLVIGIATGVNVAAGDHCNWLNTLSGVVTDVSTSKFDPPIVSAVMTNLTGTQYWESTDHGQTFVEIGTPLPENFFAVTVDVAPSDPSRIYLSGVQLDGETATGAVVRSHDGGATWTSHPIAGTDAMIVPHIGAIDPLDADRVYLRLTNVAGGLVVTDDGGDTWNAVDVGFSESLLRGLAISPDGTMILAGGEYDGVWRASTSDLAFEHVSDLAVRCFTWTEDGVYACVNELLYEDGYAIGFSEDGGDNFDPLLALSCVRQPITCQAGTTVADICTAEWPDQAERLDTAACGETGSSSSGATSGAGGDDMASHSSAATGSSAVVGGGGPIIAALESVPPGCATSAPAEETVPTWLVALCLAALCRRAAWRSTV